MTITIGFVNQKGGVGKSTLTICVAYESARRGNKTLVVDADYQGSLMKWLSYRKTDLPVNFLVTAMPTITLCRDLPAMAKDYDVVIIDSPPRTTDIAKSVICASDFIVVPCKPSAFDLWSSIEVFGLIKETTILFKPDIKFAMMISMKKGNTVIGRDIQKSVVGMEKMVGIEIPVLKSKVSDRVVFSETVGTGIVAQESDKELLATKEIHELYEEIMRLV